MILIGAKTLALLGAVQPLPAGPMTIDQAVAIAERNAFAIQLQKTTVERDRQAMALAASAIGPTVGITPLFTQNGQVTAISLGPGQPPIIISPFNSESISAGINLPIDISGNIHRLWRASYWQYQSAKKTLLGSFNDARLNARTAFLGVLRNQALVVVAQETLKDAQDRLHQAQLEFEQQQVARVDVDRFDAQAAQSTSDLLTAQNNLEIAKHAFNDALALPIGRPVDLVDEAVTPPIPSDRSGLERKAEASRPETLSLEDQIHSLALIRRAQEAGMNPTANVALTYGRNLTTTGFNPTLSTTTMVVTMSIPLFDSGATRARVKEARQDEENAKIQLAQTQLGISQQVRDAFTNLDGAQARLTNAERQVTLAEEVYRLAQVRQNAGEGTYVEVIDAETSLATARNGLVSAKYDYFQAYSQLQHAVGADRVEDQAAGVSSSDLGGKTE